MSTSASSGAGDGGIQHHPMGIVSRPIRVPDDLSVLYLIYASTRWEELKPTGWSSEEKNIFLQQQFTAQHKAYHTNYADSRFALLLFEDEVIGRLYVNRTPKDIRVVDIALLPQFRSFGYGTALLKELQEEVREKDCMLSIHVEYENPAMTLYKRLGFIKRGEKGIYHFMVWKHDASDPEEFSEEADSEGGIPEDGDGVLEGGDPQGSAPEASPRKDDMESGGTPETSPPQGGGAADAGPRESIPDSSE